MTKKILIIVFSVFALMLNSTCKYQTMATANNSQLNLKQESPINKSEVLPSDIIITANPKKNSTTEQKPFFVILGEISTEGGKIQLQSGFWGHDADEEEAKFYPDNTVELDIMNCAGYIASATTTYKGVVREVKLLNETIAEDAVEKIKQCSLSPNSEIPGSKVFGIAPASSKRRNIKINGTDTKKLYDFLVKDVVKMKPKKTHSGTLSFPSKIVKGNLFLEDDNWTDLDGDGQIDLIQFHNTPCDEKDTCTWIFRLINGKWQGIDYVFPL